VTYRAALTGRALSQFSDLTAVPGVYAVLMERIVQLTEAPWDAWAVPAGGNEPAFRQADFGEHGLLSFRIDEQAETLIIFSLLWAG
jgi:hypothetical protein